MGADFRGACLIVLTNFYMFVLYFAAERLKIGFIFLVLSLLYQNRPWNSYFLALLSISSHFSMAFIYLSLWINKIFKTALINTDARSNKLQLSLLMVLPPLLLILYESKTILWKLGTYMERNSDLSFSSFMPLSALIVLTGILS